MDTAELRECTNDRLADLEKNLRRQIFESRIKNFTNQLDDTASIRRARKDLARVKTILSERAAAGRSGEPSKLVGIKVRLSSMVANGEVEKELEGWRLTLEAAARAEVPIMVHHSVSDVPLSICPGQCRSEYFSSFSVEWLRPGP